MQKKKISTSIYNPDHIGCIMEDMLFAEKRLHMGEIIGNDHVWIISGNIWDKIIRVYQRSSGLCGVKDILMYAGPDSHMSYKIFDIEVEIAKYEKDTITLMMKNERRMKMERTCYSCKWYDEPCLGIHCRDCYGTRNWEPREVNTLKIHYNSMATTGFSRANIKVGISLIPDIKNVIFNDPATIVFWSDGTKTVVKVQDDEPYDAEKGLAMAISKKALGNQGNYCNVFKKWMPEEDETSSINIEYNGTNFLDILNTLNTCVGIKKEK